MNRTTLPTIAILAMIAGCSDDERVARIATQAADRQAQQNEEMTRLQREVAQGTRRLVEADAEARREIVVVHQELQSERGELNEQWNTLEDERKEIARQRRVQSAFVPIAQGIGMALLTALLIGFCWSLVYGLQRTDDSDAQLVEMLVRDIASDRPAILPARARRRAITNRQSSVADDVDPPPSESTDS